jgi:hypothetical protein
MRARPLRSSLAAAALAALGASGCHPDACGQFAGRTCVALLVEASSGGPGTIDQLEVGATQGFTLDASSPPMAGGATALPVTLAVLPADSFAGGAYALFVLGRLKGQVVGSASGSGSVGQHKASELSVQLAPCGTACALCVGAGDCAAPTPICLAAQHQCVQCSVDGDCSSPTPRCSMSQKCVQCTGDPDCAGTATPLCDATTGSCVQCNVKSDCSGPQKCVNHTCQ